MTRPIAFVLLPLLFTLFLGCEAETQRNASPTPVSEESDKVSGNLPTQPKSTAEENSDRRSRRFRFDYRFQLTDLPPGETVRVWLPVPPSNSEQDVQRLPGRLPESVSAHTEPKYGNEILFFERQVPPNGTIEVAVPYRVARQEVVNTFQQNEKEQTETPDPQKNSLARLNPQDKRVFLSANTRVPVTGRPVELLKEISLPKPPVDKARRLYELVDEKVEYLKQGTGWGRGDVIWVCENGYGNCTDFHSLFISLARSQNLPARFEIGFPLPEDKTQGTIGGYHCWAWFYIEDRGWIPVDISEADKTPNRKDYYFGNLTPDRVAFSVGRDIELKPKQAGPPLNFFVYPYAEIGKEPVSKEHFQLKFSFSEEDAS